jgi:CNT family concentrative nucleoside transporter
MDVALLFLRGLFGLGVLVGLAVAFSTDRRAIDWRLVGVGIALQLLFAVLVLKTSAGRAVFDAIGDGFTTLLNFTDAGSRFIFGPLGVPPGEEGSFGSVFAFQVLPTIIFFASLMGVAYHLGLVQPVVRGLGRFMAWALRISGAESLSTAANVFIGQTEAPLVIKPYVASMTRSELMTVMTGGMASIAGSVFAAYVAFLGGGSAIAGHLLSASIMSAPAAIVMAKVLVPETETPATRGAVELAETDEGVNVIEAAANGAAEGLTLALNVGAMLLAFIALIALVNALLGWLGAPTVAGTTLYDLNAAIATATDGQFDQLSLEAVFGFVFAPLAWAMGVEAADILPFGTLLGQKIAVNEFVAFASLGELRGVMSERSVTIATYALCGFANFSSIAIQIGGIGGIAPSRRSDIAALGLRAVLGGALASWMTATIAGVMIG